jgi:predicted ATP-grasp superfamily ATP-dependent carboligase
MPRRKLHMHSEPQIQDATLLIGLSGWMNGGDVSTGAIEFLVETLKAEELAHIEPDNFYIYSFPGSMEITAMFRPHTEIEEGLVREYTPPENVFYHAPGKDLILFEGKEPNMAWEEYADCVFSLCKVFDVRRVYFTGSVAGATPHTREPRVAFSASNAELRDKLKEMGLTPTSYQGPASIITYLTARATRENTVMANLIAEVPAYVQGYNPRSVETMVKLIARLLGFHIPLDDLRTAAELYEKRVSELVAEEVELAEKVSKLEREYDTEAFDREMTDLRDWAGDQGLRVD